MEVHPFLVAATYAPRNYDYLKLSRSHKERHKCPKYYIKVSLRFHKMSDFPYQYATMSHELRYYHRNNIFIARGCQSPLWDSAIALSTCPGYQVGWSGPGPPYHSSLHKPTGKRAVDRCAYGAQAWSEVSKWNHFGRRQRRLTTGSTALAVAVRSSRRRVEWRPQHHRRSRLAER